MPARQPLNTIRAQNQNMDPKEKADRDTINLKTRKLIELLKNDLEPPTSDIGETGDFLYIRFKTGVAQETSRKAIKKAELYFTEYGNAKNTILVQTEQGLKIATIDTGNGCMYLPNTDYNRALLQQAFARPPPEPQRKKPTRVKKTRPNDDMRLRRIIALAAKKEHSQPRESEALKRLKEKMHSIAPDSNINYNQDRDLLVIIIQKGIPFKTIEDAGYHLTETFSEGNRKQYQIIENGQTLATIQCVKDKCHMMTFQKAKGHKPFIKEFMEKLQKRKG